MTETVHSLGIRPMAWRGLKARFATITYGILNEYLRIRDVPLHMRDELGYTTRDKNIFLNPYHMVPCLLPEPLAAHFMLGVFGHEVLHQLLSDFEVLKNACLKKPKNEQELFRMLANAIEDPAIEYHGAPFFAGELLEALQYQIHLLYMLLPPLETATTQSVQFFNALSHYGSGGLLKGEFTFPLAKECFKVCLPYINEAIEEPDPARRMHLCEQVYAIARQLWESDEEKASLGAMQSDMIDRAKGHDHSSGAPSGTKPSAGSSTGASKAHNRRKITFLHVTKEEAEELTKNASDEPIPDDADIFALIVEDNKPKEDKPEEDASTQGCAPKEDCGQGNGVDPDTGENPEEPQGEHESTPENQGGDSADDQVDENESGNAAQHGPEDDQHAPCEDQPVPEENGQAEAGSGETGEDPDENVAGAPRADSEYESDIEEPDTPQGASGTDVPESEAEDSETTDEKQSAKTMPKAGGQDDEAPTGETDPGDVAGDEENSPDSDPEGPSSLFPGRGGESIAEDDMAGSSDYRQPGDDVEEAPADTTAGEDDSHAGAQGADGDAEAVKTDNGTPAASFDKGSAPLPGDGEEDEDDELGTISEDEYVPDSERLEEISREIEKCLQQVEAELAEENVAEDRTLIELPAVCKRYNNYNCVNHMVRLDEVERMAMEYQTLLVPLQGYINGMASKLKRFMMYAPEEREFRESGALSIPRLTCGEVKSRICYRRLTPRDRANCCIGLAIDESWSMHDEDKYIVAKMIAIILAEVFAKLNVPIKIMGFTTDDFVGEIVEHYHYLNWVNTPRQRLKLLGIKARGANFDGYSIHYMTEALKKRKEQNKLLVVCSDGAPSAAAYHHGMLEGVADTRNAIRAAAKVATVLGIGLGDADAAVLHSMYGVRYTQITDLQTGMFKFGNIVAKAIQGW